MSSMDTMSTSTLFASLADLTKQELLLQIYEQLNDALFILNADFNYVSINSAHEKMIGYNKNFIIGRPLSVNTTDSLSKNEHALLTNIFQCLKDSDSYKNNLALINRHGHAFNCQVTLQKIIANDDVFYVGLIRDISSTIENKQPIFNLLNHNLLTGLPNRRVFLSQSSDLLISCQQEIAIVRTTIDDYRMLTNRFDQDKTDSIIKVWVQRIERLELNDLLCFAHFDDDDFAFIFEGHDANTIGHQLDRLLQVCEQPFVIDDQSIYLHLSIGVSHYPKDSRQATELLKKSQEALHYIKQQGGGICWYSHHLDCMTLDHLQLEAELRAALNGCQFILHYQPKVALVTGELIGFEALVRWQHPTRGLLKPDDFIEAIIEYNLSFALFSQIAEQSAEQLAYWRTLGFTQHICINADAGEFNHPEFIEFVSSLFNKYAISSDQLQIELTERSLMLNHTRVKQQFDALKALGICMALDDFGTGYASLSYLQEYPFDFIKIDKIFISNIIDNPTQQAIVKAILELAVALNMRVIAEGIETEQQRDLLTQMGCHYAQGYWFSRPISAACATAMLSNSDAFM